MPSGIRGRGEGRGQINACRAGAQISDSQFDADSICDSDNGQTNENSSLFLASTVRCVCVCVGVV